MTREDIAKIIKESRIEAGLTQIQVADALGRPQNTISAWEVGKAQPDANTLFELFRVLGRSVDEAFGFTTHQFSVTFHEREKIEKYRTLDRYGKEMVDLVLDKEAERVEDEIRQRSQTNEKRSENNVIRIPFRCSTQSASAGTGTYLGPESFETIYVQDAPMTRRASFGVPVNGDSMEPKYHDGDILAVEGAEEIEIGEIGVFTIHGEGYVKKLGDGELISLNKDYGPIPMDDSIRCHGRVLGVLNPEWIGGE